MTLSALLYASLGGILPALVWLLFWLREDRKSPEPKGLVLKTFLLGMLAVLIVIPFQRAAAYFWPELILVNIFLWALLEEIIKFLAGYFGGLRSADDNEPIDPVIYMLTAALGFVALENTLFLLEPVLSHDASAGLITGNLRFIGASLLHIVSSGIVGLTLGFSFYRPWSVWFSRGLWGLAGATVFHAAFNSLIILWGERGMMFAFFGVWFSVILMLWLFERIKSLASQQ